MATIVFYEKPGCANNTRQKRLLLDAGHQLQVRNLLDARWEANELRAFFGGRPVAEWFNRASPRVKSGEIVPETLSETDALPLLLADPLLIRRPLMQCGERRVAGFDPQQLQDWLTFESAGEADPGHLERCVRTQQCPAPGESR